MVSSTRVAPGVTEILVDDGMKSLPVEPRPAAVDLDHALRRAEEESIASVRLGETPAADRHSEMATLYSARALELLEESEKKRRLRI